MEFSGAGAGVGAEISIVFRLRLQQKSTAPGGSGSETLDLLTAEQSEQERPPNRPFLLVATLTIMMLFRTNSTLLVSTNRFRIIDRQVNYYSPLIIRILYFPYLFTHFS